MTPGRRRGLVTVYGAVLLFGLAGLFGKWLALSPVAIVWWRSLFASITLGIGAAATARTRRATAGKVDRKTALILIGMGAFLAAHWVTFFHAIQISTVAIGLLSFSTFPVIVALLEPLLPGERFRFDALVFAVLAFAGVALVVPSFDLRTAGAEGALVGVLSGALYAVVTVLNRRFVAREVAIDALTLGLWQNAVACLLLLPLRPQLALDGRALALVALLGIVFTGVAHALFIHGLRDVPARVASLIGTLEPVVGVAAAAILLGEIPSARTLAGGGLVLATVALATRRAAGAGRSSESPDVSVGTAQISIHKSREP